ncbi:MAG: 30S ribosomal protein S11 [Planctomycetaceae bacterium]|nr:30S ribosomal protein S11 [Planctomycetaceae bacterium]
MAKRYRKKKVKKSVAKGVAHVKATFTNTSLTITHISRTPSLCAPAGTAGFQNRRKSTPFAAQKTAESAAEKAMKMGMREMEVLVKGPGGGRESAIRGLQSAGVAIKAIEDVTPLPHNGCRPRKRRRV